VNKFNLIPLAGFNTMSDDLWIIRQWLTFWATHRPGLHRVQGCLHRSFNHSFLRFI